MYYSQSFERVALVCRDKKITLRKKVMMIDIALDSGWHLFDARPFSKPELACWQFEPI